MYEVYNHSTVCYEYVILKHHRHNVTPPSSTTEKKKTQEISKYKYDKR